MGRKRKYDWEAIQEYHEQGHSIAECRRTFGFAKASWENAVRRGFVTPIRKPTSGDLSEKHCPRCKRVLPIESFHRDGRHRHSFCKECQAAVRSASYYKNRAYYLRRIEERQRELLTWFEELKASLSCLRCGFSHPGALQFHHKDPQQKDIEIYSAVRKGWSKERILRELEKCDPLCANCHFILHWEQRQAKATQHS